jgi:peptidoglycan/LPS O-acetylase OafA/YrhL
MSPEDILSRLRRFLLIFSVMLLGGAVIELWLVNHTEDPVQLIPFVLCGLGSAAALSALFRPCRANDAGVACVHGAGRCGSLLGIYLHVESNLALQREIDPKHPPER